MTEPAKRYKTTAAHLALIALLLVTALIRFWRSPYDAGGRLISPDGAEYAVSAHRLATLGTLDIDIAGVRYPIRYPPMFSAMLLAPVYAVAPGEIGNGIVIVLGFALLMVAAAYVVGMQLAGLWGAALAASAVIHHELLAQYARTIMTDIPVAALFVAGLAIYLRLRRESSILVWLMVGMICALAAGLRPLAAAIGLPFIGLVIAHRDRTVRNTLALLAPSLILFTLVGWYNHTRFGSWYRTGYSFWTPIPYEWPTLTFSTDYFWQNMTVFFRPLIGLTIMAGAAGIFILFSRKRASAARAAAFVAAGALPISVAHLYYFHVEPRFHGPLLALCAALAGAGIAMLLPRGVRSRPWLAVALAMVFLAVTRPPSDLYGSSRPLTTRLAAFVPEGGTIITRLGPVHLDATVLRPGRRQWLPVWRNQEYAGKAIAPRPIDLPASAIVWPGSHRPGSLFAAGAREAVEWTAAERPDLVAARIAAGPGVYLDAETIPPGSEPYKRIARRFDLVPVDPERRVLRLSPRAGEGESR